MDRVLRTLLGTSDLRAAGMARIWQAMREGNRRELYIGVALASAAWLRGNWKPEKRLLFREELPAGSAIVIHHREKGDPRIEVIKPARANS